MARPLSAVTRSTPRAARPRRRDAALGPLLMAAAVALSACGGSGGDGVPAAPADAGAAASRKTVQAVDAPAVEPHRGGAWGPVQPWPLLPIHAVLLPDGRLLSYGSRADGQSSAFFSVDLWDVDASPDAGHAAVPNGTGNDLFCSAQLLLPPGLDARGGSSPTSTVFIAGGDVWNGTQNTFTAIRGSTTFDAGANALVRGPEMARARWYSSPTMLPSGEIYLQGGSGGADQPEVRRVDGTLRPLTGIDSGFLQWSYPRNFVLPDGRLFGYDYEGRLYFVDPGGSGNLSPRHILPWRYFGAGTAVMFRPGRILQVGGNSNATAVIDVTGADPVFTPTQSLSTVRKLMNGTLLPDGRVLVTGGSPTWNELEGANRAAEIWDPVTGQWTVGAAQQRARLYHSSAILLPDGTVLTGGGGAPAPVGADFAGERNVEVYQPPYLFTAAGARAPRPTIDAAPDALEIGKPFVLRSGGGSGGAARVTLVKHGSVTHGYNLDQRFVELAFTRAVAAGGGEQLTAAMTSRPGDATPGYYLLFVIDAAGVPSAARTVRLGIAPPADARSAPTVAGPATLAATAGTALSRGWTVAGPTGARLTWSAAGLPPGLRIDAASGVVAGTPTTPGSFDAVVAVSDGARSATAATVWRVASTAPLALTVAPTPAASLAGAGAAFAATASGVGVEYAWNFGDGTPATAWSSSSAVVRAYARPGTYTVTLSVRDAAGATLVRSFLQTVYLGSPDPRPAVSGPLLFEEPRYGAPRLWVVNPDNDSVTAFDALTHARLAEVAVGAGPRAVAATAAGQVWVTNKDGASISVLDPFARTVVRTLALPRASRPHGLAVSPARPQAFVALEATGELLRFDTDTHAPTGRLALGAGVRHVSVGGDGKRVYVTRFVTPALPGEDTAAVAAAPERGGEVVEVDAASMTVVRTVVLAASTRADAENAGAGVPNYLGPLVLSPDGSQGYVPSKQDNVARGAGRNGLALNFQNTVRAVSSRVLLGSAAGAREDAARRVDHDNAGVASAATFDRLGVLMFVALETSREVAVLDAHSGQQITRISTGRAPQGLALSGDGYTLYVHNFMDRSVGVYDLTPLVNAGTADLPLTATLAAVATERLAPAVLRGKQLFYDARDTRLARDGYLSCAACHADGGHDGRTWDFTHAGEGLRNTPSLRGRAGAQGRLHWSANFDEVQDFEGQIRALAGGSGLMSDADFGAGTRSRPLGDRKAGLSADLDALAAYVASLSTSDPSPARAADGSLTADAVAGRAVFAARCAGCHGGRDFTNSADAVLVDVGTRRAASGQRAFAPLAGLDVPTLRGAWATAPYLHDGRAPTLAAAVQAHAGANLTAADLAAVVAYTAQIDDREAAAPTATANLVVSARATLLGGVGAAYAVRVDGVVVGSGQLDARGFVDLAFGVPALAAGARVDVVFGNDAANAGEDRNLVVQSLRVNHAATLGAVASNAPIDFGRGAQAFDGLDLAGAAATGGWMARDGAMRFTLGAVPPPPAPPPSGPAPPPPAPATTALTVRARATLAAGVGAQMTLLVNGSAVGSVRVAATAVQDFAFTAPLAVAAGDRVDVVFSNDATAGTEDRNLYVESVAVRGVLLRPSDAGAVIDNGLDQQAFDGLDVVPATQWGGWLARNGALRLVAR